ncbi:choice-of-anchor I family protein [Rhodohalobacter mucosus]|uniref:Alkaline phosphatase n=1 Tax=Rhodohalobacter mucosus TaxID=2079485 RepID=A0A316TN14_9BACT|nr:choice-of-anchor I family protein [Rhodohalobacter mucosus]PWN06003.1 alkaline phosphatase [Rhodohalobacter mucosus]
MMKFINASIILLFFIFLFSACSDVLNNGEALQPESPEGQINAKGNPASTNVNFQYRSTINVGGEGSAEISAYDESTQKLFVVNVESSEISVFTLTDLDNPIEETPISVSGFGVPNSVAVNNGLLAVAVEAPVKQDPGFVLVFNTGDLSQVGDYEVGALPDMVTFTKNGQLILSANEGEPNDDYTVDPLGSVSIINLKNDDVTTLDFTAFNGEQEALEERGLRVFGPGATLAQDVEPEYIAISENSRIAWVSLQENNGIARVNIRTKTIEAIYPLGFKDYSLPENSLDASDRDGVKELKNWPVFGMYQPDAIVSAKIKGKDYIFSANEGDARDYDGFSEEERIDDLTLDSTVFPNAATLQQDENLGRLEITTTLGDTDNDGEYEQLYSYGARSFSVWSPFGDLLYDSGNGIAAETLAQTPGRFNDDDGRSDAKGAEPEAVEILNMGGQRHILFVGLERNDQILVYDVSNPLAPEFLSILSNPGDEAPEGVLAVPAKESPTGRDLLIVSYEDSGTISFFENF